MVEWLFKGMCWINIDGENKFKIKPIIDGNISFARGEYKSIYGVVKVKWNKVGDSIKIEIEIPSNTSAIFLFKDKEFNLLAGKYSFTF